MTALLGGSAARAGMSCLLEACQQSSLHTVRLCTAGPGPPRVPVACWGELPGMARRAGYSASGRGQVCGTMHWPVFLWHTASLSQASSGAPCSWRDAVGAGAHAGAHCPAGGAAHHRRPAAQQAPAPRAVLPAPASSAAAGAEQGGRQPAQRAAVRGGWAPARPGCRDQVAGHRRPGSRSVATCVGGSGRQQLLLCSGGVSVPQRSQRAPRVRVIMSAQPMLPRLPSFLAWGWVGLKCQEMYRRSQQLLITWHSVRSCNSYSKTPGRHERPRCACLRMSMAA